MADTWDRERIARRTAGLVRKGHWGNADICLVEEGGRRYVFKDFRPRSLLIRSTWGRLLAWRERRVYRRLDDLPGVPSLIAAVDPYSILIEHVDGKKIRLFRPGDLTEEFLKRLRDLIDGMHRRGVVHLDVNHSANLLVDPAGRPHLVDFEGAFCFSPSRRLGRWLTRALGLADVDGYLKWKERLFPGSLTPAERRFRKRSAWFRRFWIFN